MGNPAGPASLDPSQHHRVTVQFAVRQPSGGKQQLKGLANGRGMLLLLTTSTPNADGSRVTVVSSPWTDDDLVILLATALRQLPGLTPELRERVVECSTNQEAYEAANLLLPTQM